jgi:hypothetical protein
LANLVGGQAQVQGHINNISDSTTENVESQRGRVGTRLLTFVLACYNAYAQLNISVVYCWLLLFTSDVHDIFTVVISARAG